MSDLPQPLPWHSELGIDPAIVAQMNAYGAPPMAQQLTGIGPLDAPSMLPPMPAPAPEVPIEAPGGAPPPVAAAPPPALPLPVQSATPEADGQARGKVIVRLDDGQTELITPEQAEGRAQQWDKLRAGQAADQTKAQGDVYKQQLGDDAALQTKQAADWEVTKGDLQRRQMRYDQDVDDLAKHGTVDSEAWWKSRSAGRQFAAIFAAGAAGFLQGTKGGSNTAIDAMSKAIDQNISAQEATLSSKRATLGLEQQGIDNVRQAGQAEWEHVQAMRDAAWKGVELKAKVAMAGVNPAGVQAANLQQIVAGAQQQRQTIALDVQQKRTQMAVEQHTMKNEDAVTAIARGHLGLARQQAKDTHEDHIGTTADRTLKMGYVPDPATGRPMPDGSGGFKRVPAVAAPAMTDAQAKEHEEAITAHRKNNEELQVGDVYAKQSPEDAAVGKPKQLLKTRDVPTATALATQKAGLDQTAALVGRITQLRTKYHGVASAMENSPEYRALKSDWASLKFAELKSMPGGTRYTDAIDHLLSEKTAGGLDATAWRDISAGLKEGLRSGTMAFNAAAATNNSSGNEAEPYEPPKTEAEAAEERSLGDNFKVITQGIPPDLAKDPAGRKAEFQRKLDTLDAMLTTQSPPPVVLHLLQTQITSDESLKPKEKDELLKSIGNYHGGSSVGGLQGALDNAAAVMGKP